MVGLYIVVYLGTLGRLLVWLPAPEYVRNRYISHFCTTPGLTPSLVLTHQDSRDTDIITQLEHPIYSGFLRISLIYFMF